MTSQSFPHYLSRRALLKSAAGLAGLGAASGLLNGCALPGQPGATGAQAGQTTLDIYTLIPAFFMEMGMAAATDLYNEQIAADNKRIVVEESPDGWETKALAMIREGNVRWSASGYAQFDLQWNYIQQGLCQPIDDLLQASAIPFAQDYANSFIYSNIYDTTRFEGKTYFIPMKLNIFMAGYRQDYLEAAGYETLPETWDEFEIMLGKIKETQEDVVPFAVRKDIFRTLGIAFTTFVENPYDENFMLKVDSEEFRECLRMFKRWFDQGYTNLQLMQDPMPDWQLGKVAVGLDSHSWIRLGRSVLGDEKITGGLPPKVNAGDPPRTWIHVDSSFVFADAPHPQEGLDWLLSILGPEGAPADRHWSGTLTLSGMPVHQNQYDRLLADGSAAPELTAVYEAVPTSTLVPMEAGKYLPIINAKLIPWVERYWGGEVDLEQAMQNAMDEINGEIEKQIA
jgi:ABC-type glycerol-3-phosphate transport system substrate-binding protein